VRYLLVGLGNIGRKRQVVLGDRCVATVDPVNPAADHAAVGGCPDDSYDAAVLAVPTAAKLDLVERFLSRGKHVRVEKPVLFPDRAAAERLQQIAAGNHAVWYTSYNHRFEPLVCSLRGHLASGAIGRLYHGRLLYGNGTAGNLVGTWRDAGLGAVEDLAPHLIDLVGHLLDRPGLDFMPWTIDRHETAGVDHAILASVDRQLMLEVSYLSWKNSFAIELYGDRGSVHLHGLRKWGLSELIVRQRVLPSGAPIERRETSEGEDVTWARDVEHFEGEVAAGRTSVENDWWISRVMGQVAAVAAQPAL
jgi:predicted dehydrogenase